MTRRALQGALLLALTLHSSAACRRTPPGDSGGAATGDQVEQEGIGSARSHDSFEQARPRDTTAATEIHGELGADTSAP